MFTNEIVVGSDYQVLIYDVRQQDQVCQVIQTLGNQQNEKGNDIGEFNVVCGVCVDDEGALWVTDFGNHRVQRFSI